MGKPILLILFLALAGVANGQVCSEYLHGRISDETGQPLPQAVIQIEPSSYRSISDVNGRFSFSSLCPGEYRLTVTYMGYESASRQVRIPLSEEVIITLQPSRTVLKDVVIEAGVGGRSVTQTSVSLETEDLEGLHGKPLGESLKEIPGVSALQTGPSIFKPVIDGLHSQRILILNNGIRQEGQQWGLEHAPEIDPFIASRIEVLKGAEAVRYGSAAMGGVIIIQPPPLHETEKTGGEINTGFMSNNRMGILSVMVEGTFAPQSPWSWRLQGSSRKGGDYHAPSYNLSNTGLEEFNFSGALGFEDDRRGFEVYASTFNTEIGILRAAHTGNLSDLEESIESGRPWYVEDFTFDIGHPKQRTHHHLLKLSAHQHFPGVGRVSVLYGGQFDVRREYDIRRADRAGRPSVSLNLISHVLDVSLDHERPAHTGSLGINVSTKSNTNDTEVTGVRPLLPDYRQLSAGVFFHEKIRRNKWTFEAGARYDFQYLQVLTFERNQLIKPTFNFNYLSGTLGASILFNPRLRLSSNLGMTSRPPHVSELYSEGLHHGTASIEEGLMRREGEVITDQSSIDLEFSRKWVNSLQYTAERITADFSVYYNAIDNYVFIHPVGTRQTIRGYFPVLQYDQTDVVLAGSDLAVKADIGKRWSVNTKISYVYAKDILNDDVVISIPPAQWDNGITYRPGSIGKLNECFIGVSVPITFRQHRAPRVVAPQDIDEGNSGKIFDFTQAPPGYTLLNVRAGFKLPIGDHTLGVTLSGENLLNTSYRNYMNRLRYFADDIGSNFILRLSYNFLSH